MPKQTPQAAVFSGWLEQKVRASAECIVDMLGVERMGAYEGLPQELVASIHNEVLWQVVIRINFPVNSLEPDREIDEAFFQYEQYTREKAHLFFALCRLLAAWCPNDGRQNAVSADSQNDRSHALGLTNDADAAEDTKH